MDIVMYRINRQDEIVFVNDEWLRFSFENGAGKFQSENVLNKSLWNFIADDLTRELYKVVLRRVRNGATISFSFRCDAADFRLLLEMTVTNLPNGEVQFETKPLWRHEREPQPLLETGAALSGEEFLRICGWCQRVDVGVSDWREIEIAMTKLKLFEQDSLPQLTHGICNSCYETMTEKLAQKCQPQTPAIN